MSGCPFDFYDRKQDIDNKVVTVLSNVVRSTRFFVFFLGYSLVNEIDTEFSFSLNIYASQR